MKDVRTLPVSEAQPVEPAVETERAPYSVSLPTFEGPLDLLLQLCQKHELNILDIPIGFVTEKYLEYISIMQALHLDVAAEYLVMAATLAHIKSKMLLPQVPEGQEDEALLGEEEDPREALIRRLLEYQKYKAAGIELAGRGIVGNDVFLRGSAVEEAVTTGVAPLAAIPLFSLMDAFARVLERSHVKLSHDVVADRLSISDRIHQLVEILRDRGRATFEELFEGVHSKFDLVITFLALLEMTKLKMTRLSQADPNSALYVEVARDSISPFDGVGEVERALLEEEHPAEPKVGPIEDMSTEDSHIQEHEFASEFEAGTAPSDSGDAS